MSLQKLFVELSSLFDGSNTIDAAAQEALLSADCRNNAQDANSASPDTSLLPEPFLNIMSETNAHPVCATIAQIPFQWAPPQTSGDALYIQHSLAKVHVELLGPGGLVESDQVRIGLYGMLPDAEYGIRTHPAEELYVMLAGEVYWKRDTDPYLLHMPGERSHHPSMMEHANKTTDKAFMSIYVWHGDIATDNYRYTGKPS